MNICLIDIAALLKSYNLFDDQIGLENRGSENSSVNKF